MRRFFFEKRNGDFFYLDQEESRHLSQVLRAKEGDQVELIDGSGILIQAEIISIGKKETELKLVKEFASPSKSNLPWIAVAPTKNINRWEWFLEKATEIGVARISPILCDHSERKVLKMDRQLRILKEAMKQSQRLFLPQLDELIPFSHFVENADIEQKFIAHCEADEEKNKLKNIYVLQKPSLILIGPEGDFSKEEIELAKKVGYTAVDLGESRLRTETAAIVACHTLNLLND